MPSPRPAFTPPGALRGALAATAAIGALCLLASTFATIIRIQVGTTSKVSNFDTHLSGWDRHGPALALLAIFALMMVAGALRGARPAAAALGAIGLVALVLIAITDLPHLNEVGFIGKLYEDAVAGPRAGFFLETAGAVLMLAAGGLMLLVSAEGRVVPGAGGSDDHRRTDARRQRYQR